MSGLPLWQPDRWWRWRRFGVVAFVLACVEPAALVIAASTGPFGHDAEWDSLSLAVAAACALAGPAGVLLGAWVVIAARLRHWPMPSHAVAAIWVGIVATGITVFMAPVIDQSLSKGGGHGIYCISNIKQLNLAVLMYSQDWNDRFPPGHSWGDVIFPYIKNRQVYHCPADGVPDRPTYGLNGWLQRGKQPDVLDPDRTVMSFDSIPGTDLFGGPWLLPDPPRHNSGHNVGFVDGHAKWCKPEVLAGDVKGYTPSGVARPIWQPVFRPALP